MTEEISYRAARERYGLTLNELAKRSGISKPGLCNAEAGRRQLSLKPAARWAEAESLRKCVLEEEKA